MMLGTFMKENGKIIREMVKEDVIMQMAISIKEHGRMIRNKERVR